MRVVRAGNAVRSVNFRLTRPLHSTFYNGCTRFDTNAGAISYAEELIRTMASSTSFWLSSVGLARNFAVPTITRFPTRAIPVHRSGRSKEEDFAFTEGYESC